MEMDELGRVAPVRLDPLAQAPRRQRGRDHVPGYPEPTKLARRMCCGSFAISRGFILVSLGRRIPSFGV
jgi:hypothetical protein